MEAALATEVFTHPHGYTSIYNTSVSHRDYLEVLPATIEGSPGPVELLMQTLRCVGLLHKGESCLDVSLSIKGHQSTA